MRHGRTTISDIAREAGVDKSTVSLVLNRKPLASRIRKDTQRRIFAIVKRLNYQPSFVAKSLFTGKTMMLGLLVGGIETPFFAELTNTALEAADERGYYMLVSATRWDLERERKALRLLLQRQVDGIICAVGGLCPLGGQHELYKFIIEQHYPMVLLGYQADGLSSVCPDYSTGMDEAVRLLAENGHTRIGYCFHGIQWNDKEESFLSVCGRHNIEAVRYLQEAGPCGMNKIAGEIIKSGHPKAFLVFDDSSAMEMIAALKDIGGSVPDDFDIIGIDGIAWGASYRPKLTTIKQDLTQLMNSAVNLLVEMIGNPEWEAKNISVPTRLLIKETVNLKKGGRHEK
ncbi:MAG: LacI family DNA-binding transcriptional regulator [Victivallales bacterium]